MAGSDRPRLAAIVVGYENRWHGDNLVTRLLNGYRINATLHPPRCEIASVYTLRAGPGDLSAGYASEHGFTVFPTIADALTLGTDRLAVDGVVVVTEAPGTVVAFADNPFRAFFEEIVAVFRREGRGVPVFWDKQLAAHWDDARWMVDQAQSMGFALAAGSVIPATFRRPALDMPVDTPLVEAISVASVPPEHVQSLTFHAVELLQSLVERRPGGETGIQRLELLDGPAVWRARDDGRWSGALFDAAVSRSLTRRDGRPEDLATNPMALLIDYRDGFRASVVSVPGYADDFTAAVQIAGEPAPRTTLAYYVSENGNSFSCLVRQIEDLMLTGRPVVPVERTLLSSGVIDFMLRARSAGVAIPTPELAVAYRAPDRSVFCEGEGS